MKNIHFDRLPYKRIDYEKTKKKVESFINQLKESTCFKEYLSIFQKIIDIQNEIEETCDYADIRNMRDSEDEYFDQEINYWNEYKSKFDLLFNPFYELCLNSKYRVELSRFVPPNFFYIIECQLKITSPDIIDLTQKENELKNEYKKIMREKILYEGEERNLSFISGFFSDKNRKIRQKAHDTVNDFYYKNQSKLDQLLFDLITVRNEIAKNLGFHDYAEYSLYALKRFGYNYSDISHFRNYIIEYIIPLCKKLNQWKKEQLGIEDLKYYDTIFFEDMPKSIYNGKDLLKEFGDCLKGIDIELYTLYQEMLDKNYIDLENREHKVNFAITNYLTKTGLPVITGNYKNTYADIQTTSHELGHAFQKYHAGIMDQNYVISPLLKYPTFEIAEMFSHAMELITMHHLNRLFTDEDYQKYCFMEIYHFVGVLPYICLVDEFQEQIYTKENLKKENIRTVWLKLAHKYELGVSNTGHINLESGGYFYRQSHIFLNPFYYIDYALSYFGAFSIANACNENLELFQKVGSVASYYPIDELIEKFDMPNPFDEEAVKNIAQQLEQQLIQYKNTINE